MCSRDRSEEFNRIRSIYKTQHEIERELSDNVSSGSCVINVNELLQPFLTALEQLKILIYAPRNNLFSDLFTNKIKKDGQREIFDQEMEQVLGIVSSFKMSEFPLVEHSLRMFMISQAIDLYLQYLEKKRRVDNLKMQPHYDSDSINESSVDVLEFFKMDDKYSQHLEMAGFTKEQIKEQRMNREEVVTYVKELEALRQETVGMQKLLNELQSLSLLQQGTKFDRIDWALSAQEKMVANGTKSLGKADVKQKAKIWIVVIFILSVVAFASVFAVALKFLFQYGPSIVAFIVHIAKMIGIIAAVTA